jgi:hypothetical protein
MKIFESVYIVKDGDMNLASIVSDPIGLDHQVMGAVQAVFTGSPVGTLTLEATLFNYKSTTVTAVWTTITGSSVAVTAAGDEMYNLTQLPYKAVRLRYTKTSGTGTLNVLAGGKGF